MTAINRLNKPQTNGPTRPRRLPDRPISWICALGLLGVSVHLAHTGLSQLYSPSVAGILTLAFVFLAWLNWQAVSRLSRCFEVDDIARAQTIMALSGIMAIGEAWLTHHGFLALAASDGQLLATSTAWIFSLGLAALNLWGKYGFVSAIGEEGSTSAAHRQAPETEPLDWSSDRTVLRFTDRMARNEGLERKDEKAHKTATKTVAERLKREAARIRTRCYRARKRAEAAA